MFGHIEIINNVGIVRVVRRRLSSNVLVEFRNSMKPLLEDGRTGVIFDFSKVARLPYSGLAALVEFVSDVPKGFNFAYVGLTKTCLNRLSSYGYDRILPIFPSVDLALASPAFQSTVLADVSSVILCAGKGSRMHPLTTEVPKPMMPFLGKPVLERIIDHLGHFGINKVFLNPGHLGPQIHKHFGNGTPAGRSIFYLNEGKYNSGIWEAAPLGSASTLLKLAKEHSAFDNDFIVLCGDALIDVNLADMMEQHRATGADVTIAAQKIPLELTYKYGIVTTDPSGRVATFQEKPDPKNAKSDHANTGIYIFSPSTIDDISDEPDQDIATHLLPRILARGGYIHRFDSDFTWVDLGCGQDYANGMADALNAKFTNALPNSTMIKPGVWAGPEAKISSFAQIVPPVFVANGAEIQKSAKIVGPATIGRNCVVERGSLIKNSHVFDDSFVQKGSIIQDMIVSPFWCVDHRYADGTLQNVQPLDGVTHVEDIHSKQNMLKRA